MAKTQIDIPIDINVPAQQVWSAIVDWQSQGEWMLGTRVWPVNGDGTGVGGEIAAFTGIGKLGFLDTMTITVWEPPVRCEVLHTGRVVRGIGIFAIVETSPTTSRFEWSEILDLPLGIVGALGFRLVRPFFVFGVRKSLQKFAAILESRTN